MCYIYDQPLEELVVAEAVEHNSELHLRDSAIVVVDLVADRH